MKAMFDLNVIVDIAEAREGFCEKSREAFERAVQLGVQIYFPIHGFTTLHYLLAHAGKGEDSKSYISWLCDHVECAPVDKSVIKSACLSSVRDFEDAVVDETAFAALVLVPLAEKSSRLPTPPACSVRFIRFTNCSSVNAGLRSRTMSTRWPLTSAQTARRLKW